MPANRTSPSPQLQISILGPLRVVRDGAEPRLGGPRQRAVLVRLALAAGDTVAVDRLIHDLWADAPPPSALATLQSYVSNLRRALATDGETVVERSGAGYRLAVDPGHLASVRFERLVAEAVGHGPLGPTARIELLDEALGLWHGPALADVAEEEWARGDAVRLEELRVTALEARFQLLLDTGQHAVVVGDLEAAVGVHPLRERLTEQLMVALYRCGRQAEALRAYERTRAHLADELGLDPTPELARLAGAVLDHDASLTAPAASEAGDTPSGAGTRGSAPLLPLPPAVAERRARSGFVGRQDELAALEAAWDAVDDGERRVVTLTGEAGMGKTRLAQAFARRVHDGGAHVLWGRCSAENLIAYQPVVEALRTALRSLDPEVANGLVAPRPALAALVPDLARPDEARVKAGRADRHEVYELYETLAELLDEVTTGVPVLLVVDDIQWADPSTLALLQHLLRHDRAGRLLVLGTVRRPAGRPTPDLDRFLADTLRDDRLDALEVAGLGVNDVAQLLHGRGLEVPASVARTVRQRTSGNPFFVEALAEYGGDLTQTDDRALPASVRDVLDLRLTSLDPEATRVLTAAAVMGMRTDLGLLGAVCDVAPDPLLDVVDAAVAAGLLTEDEELGWVTFPHALVRQALVARTTRIREAQLHLKVAAAVQARADVPDRAVTIAQHLMAAGRACPPEEAARAALAAGHDTLDQLAPDEARTWARRALDALDAADEPDPALRAEAVLLVAIASRHLGERDVGREAIAQLAAEARRRGDPLLLARAAHEAALLASVVGFSFGAIDEGLLALLTEALDALPPGHAEQRATLLAWSAIALTGWEEATGRQRTLTAEALEVAAGIEAPPALVALTALARHFAIAGPGGLDERLEIGPRMLDAAVAAGSTDFEVVALVLRVVDLTECGRVTEALATIERLRDRLHPFGRPVFDTYLYFLEAAFALLRGDLDAAEVSSLTAIEQGEAAHGGNATQAWAAQQFVLAWERGTLGTLVPLVQSMVDQYPTMAVWRAALASCQVGAGRPDLAREAYAPVVTDGRLAVPDDSIWYTTVGQLAEVAWSVGDADAAQVLADALAPVADRLGITGMGAVCIGHLARPYGLALATAGDLDGAEVQLAAAAERAATCGFAPWRARALADRATVLERRRGPGDADEAARCRTEAGALADALGIRLALGPD